MVKNPPASARDRGDVGSISGSGRSLGGGHGNPFQYFYLGNSMDRGAWQVTVHRTAQSQTTEATEPNSKLKPSVVLCIFSHQLFSGHSHSEVSLGSRRR